MRPTYRLCLIALLLATCAGASLAQGPEGAIPKSLLTDAESYAAARGVGLDEAVRRLRLQDDIGELNAILAEAERGTFAGLWIEHAPEYRVVVRTTSRDAGERILGAVAGTKLENLVQVAPAAFSLDKLEAAQAAAHHLAGQLGAVVESEINVQANWVQLYAVDPGKLESGLASVGIELPAGVVVFPVERLSTPHVNIYGGLPLSTCTSGFTVKNGAGTRGVTTAAHCSNSQSYNGQALTFQAADQQGSQDVQWHTTPNLTDTAQFNSGVGVRDCTATHGRANQAVGDFVCGNGKTTGYKCGDISSTTYAISYVTDSNATFIRVHNSAGTDLSEGGDSGGPWFIAGSAYGTHSGSPGANENDALYMAINYVSGINVTVVLAP